MEKEQIDRYSKHLTQATRHCLKSLLDFADALKRNEKEPKVCGVIEAIKGRLHNDIPALHQQVSSLLLLSLMDGEIPPLSNNGDHKS